MKYALIGCGRIAVNHIKAALNNKLDIISVCDIDLSHIDVLFEKTKFKDVYESKNVNIYIDYKEMIEKCPEIELVAIATDSGIHAEIAKYCIKKGKNVIIEKPMAMSMSDCEEIIELAKEYNVKVSVCHQNRFNLAIQEMRKALETGRFGKISHGSINVRWNRGKDYYDQASWRGKWESDGGCLFNQCIHGIDLLRWMMNDEVDEVYGVTKQQFHHYIECEDIGMAVIKFKNGAIGTIEGTVNVFKENLEETLYLFGEKGTCKIGGKSTNNIDFWNFSDCAIDDDKNKNLQEETSNVYGNGHTALYADVIDAIKNDRKPYVDAVAGRNAVEMILAIYKSSYTGQPVKLPLKNVASIDFIGMF
ncbi:MAG: Gfo/Idh/MocA family oxidoreductase [Lachnospiraceae bacterium]|nr:Gfo/Idh/MocA family oxidoreductase [Lachnospiraceae bacterium]